MARIERKDLGIGCLICVVTLLLPALFLGLLSHDPTHAEALYFAVREEDDQAVRRLLSRGADPNRPGEFGYPLEAAVESGRTDIVKILIGHGARTNLYANGRSPVRIAADAGNWEMVEILKATGAKR